MAESDATNPITADEFDDIHDEAYDESTTTSYVTSIASSIRRGIEENGRTYPTFGKNMYALPVDDEEQDRNDLQHCKILLILDGKLHLAPITQTPHRILDLGTGSGIWAIDIADAYASALVTGVDIAPVQPLWIPTNCQFEIDDIENDWLYEKNIFDFIHARELMMMVRDWPRLMTQSLDHLRPGGYLEVSGTFPLICCDDNTLPPNSAYQEASKVFFEMGDAMGAPIDAPVSWKGTMERAGFLDVVENIYKIPMGPWAKDRRLKQIGAFELTNLLEGFEAYTMRGYTQILGGDLNTLKILLAQARKEISNPNMHTFVYFYNVYGRKAEATQGPLK